MAYVEQSPGAHVLFQVAQHRISVFILQDRAPFRELGSTDSAQLSFDAETWSQGGLCYFVIGDASPADIRALSDLLRRAGRS